MGQPLAAHKVLMRGKSDRLLALPPNYELFESDVAVAFGIGYFEIEQALFARHIAVELLKQRVEFLPINEAVTVEVARIENSAQLGQFFSG
jgi:hypothetical protein